MLAVVGSIAVVGALTPCALLLCVCVCVCVLKAAQRNVQHSLIRELMLYGFQQGHKAAEETKNICCVKGKYELDHCTVIKLSKTFHSGCKNVDDQAKSGRPKTVDFEATVANLASSSRRVSGEFSISKYSVVFYFYDLGVAELCFNLPKYCKTFELL